VWSRDGQKLFYRSPSDRGSVGDVMMVVDVQTSPTFRASRPRVLFSRTDMIGFDVAADGRFLVLKRLPEVKRVEQTQEMHVVVNRIEELRRRVPPIP
jgi:hypothetical protein